MTWRATFVDGPCHRDHVFLVGPPWRELILAPMPEPHGWTIVAGDGIPELDDAPARVPWTGEVTYRLVAERGVDSDGDLVVEYGVVEPCPACGKPLGTGTLLDFAPAVPAAGAAVGFPLDDWQRFAASYRCPQCAAER